MNQKDPIFPSSTVYIPDDLVIEILSRLPTKSLSRFRCVSKLWTTLISHVTSQRTIFLPMPGLFCFTLIPPEFITELYIPISPKSRQFRDVFESRLSSLPFYYTYYVTHCCNGLLLFICWGVQHLPSRLIVWNPATMEFVHVRGLPPYNRSCIRYFLAYDPRKSPHYKVFEFTLHTKDTLINVNMYSSMSQTWDTFCSITHQHPLVCDLVEGSPVFHKGALYMITTSQDYVKECLFRFDTDKGSFDSIMLPGKPAKVEHVCIGESRGHLYCAVDYRNPECKREIYMLDEKNSVKWVLTHKMGTWNGDPHDYQPIAFHPESELIFLSMTKKMISYNPNNREFEEIYVATDNLKWLHASLLIPCLESLDPPGSKLINSLATNNSM